MRQGKKVKRILALVSVIFVLFSFGCVRNVGEKNKKMHGLRLTFFQKGG